YLQAEGSALPELKRVIVAYGTQISMEPTLEQALGRVFGGLQQPASPPAAAAPGAPQAAPGAAGASGETPTPSPRVAALIAEANSDYERAQAALRAGDFAAYGREVAALGQVLQQLKQATRP
ncbi:MAG TPA: UPF0182 family protein, partial [bacterium]|nr:UPF0182 family protein [bacterium]